MNRVGFSLLELIVAIAVIGLIVGIVAVAPRQSRSTVKSRFQASRATALSSGHTIVAVDSSGAMVVSIAAYPSGIVVTDTSYTQDRSLRAGSADR